jgi:hypothetical protein
VLVGDGGSVYLPEDGDVEVNLQMLDVETRLALAACARCVRVVMLSAPRSMTEPVSTSEMPAPTEASRAPPVVEVVVEEGPDSPDTLPETRVRVRCLHARPQLIACAAAVTEPPRDRPAQCGLHGDGASWHAAGSFASSTTAADASGRRSRTGCPQVLLNRNQTAPAAIVGPSSGLIVEPPGACLPAVQRPCSAVFESARQQTAAEIKEKPVEARIARAHVSRRRLTAPCVIRAA